MLRVLSCVLQSGMVKLISESRNEERESALVVSCVYMCLYSLFKALTMCSVYKALATC